MSTPHETTVTCQGCNATQSFTVWQSLNVTLDCDAKQRLLTGELTRFTCQKCGWSGPVIYPFLYHDMEKRLMVWLWTDAGEPDLKDVPPAALMKDYRLRLVASRNQLVEKILIFDDDLDDRVIEFLKLILHAQASEGNHPLEGELFFAGLGTDSDGKESVEFEHVMDTGNQALAVPVESYQMLAGSLSPKLSTATGLDNWLRVDRNFAQALMA